MPFDPPTLIYLATIRLPTEKAHGLQIMKTCEALAGRGVELRLLVPKRKNILSGSAFDFYQIKQNFKLDFVPCVDAINWLIGRFGFWLTNWSFYRQAKKFFTPNALFYTRDLLLAMALTRDHKPFIYEIHSLPEKASKHHIRVWQSASGIVVISDGLKNQLIAWGVSESKITVARDAVEVEKFQIAESKHDCRQKLNLPLDGQIVVYTGHLYAWKGAGILAQAATILPQATQVYLVGGTNEDVARFKTLYTAPNLHIVGWQPHAQMPFWNKAADVLVIPTSGKEKIGAVYTSPMKLFEYLVSGNPIVASAIPALQEILSEDRAIFFVPDNAPDLARAVQQALTTPPQAKAGDLSEYSWGQRAIIIANFINTLNL